MYLLIYSDLLNHKSSIVNKPVNNSDEFNKYCMQIFTLLNKKTNFQLTYTVDNNTFVINKQVNVVNNGWFYSGSSTKIIKMYEIKLTPVHEEYTNYITELDMNLDELINLNNLFTETIGKKSNKTLGNQASDNHDVDSCEELCEDSCDDNGNCDNGNCDDKCHGDLINMILDDSIDASDASDASDACGDSGRSDRSCDSDTLPPCKSDAPGWSNDLYPEGYKLKSQTYKALLDDINPVKVTHEYPNVIHDSSLYNLFDTENDDSLNTYMDNYTVTNLNNIINGVCCTSGSYIASDTFKPVYSIKQSDEPSKFIDKLNNLLKVNPTESRKFIFNPDSYFYN